MSVHSLQHDIPGRPAEALLLAEVTVRLLTTRAERQRCDDLLTEHHYLHHAKPVGRVLRYVVEYRGQWLAVLTFVSAAYHLKPRDRWLHWDARRVTTRRHLLAQNARFLVLANPGHWPNLATFILGRVTARLPDDWCAAYGQPVLAVETFVDPQRFRGTCYKAAGWERLGDTQGFARGGQDFYTDIEHPKELWVRPLSTTALATLRAAELPPALQSTQPPPPPRCPIPTGQFFSLWQYFQHHLDDYRAARGTRYQLGALLSLAALGIVAGCEGPEALSEFAHTLTHPQRSQLRCPPVPGQTRQFMVPCARTFRRLLARVDSAQLLAALVAWQARADGVTATTPPPVIHVDGKTVKNAEPAPATDVTPVAVDTPPETQKPKADRALGLVNFMTTDQRLIDQVAIPGNTNEEAATAARFRELDLVGAWLTADAAHLTKANCRQLVQENGADYLLALKGNQPTALATASALLTGASPPAGQNE